MFVGFNGCLSGGMKEDILQLGILPHVPGLVLMIMSPSRSILGTEQTFLPPMLVQSDNSLSLIPQIAGTNKVGIWSDRVPMTTTYVHLPQANLKYHRPSSLTYRARHEHFLQYHIFERYPTFISNMS